MKAWGRVGRGGAGVGMKEDVGSMRAPKSYGLKSSALAAGAGDVIVGMLYPTSIGSCLIDTGGKSKPTACAPAAGDDVMCMAGCGMCDVRDAEFVVAA